MKAVKYMVVLLIAVQLLLPSAFALSSVYSNRPDYKLMLDNDNFRGIDAVLEQVRRDIKKRGTDDYYIMLGDSVFFGSPGSSSQVVNAFLQQKPGAPMIYNLSLPANQLGDMYTMLLKLERFGIKTDRLIFNIRYASFIPREPGPRSVFWFGNDLRRLDPESYARVLEQLKTDNFKTPQNVYEKFQQKLHEDWLPELSLIRYKDYFRQELHEAYLKLRNRPLPDDALGDANRWDAKAKFYGEDFLKNLLQDPLLIRSFTDKPFDLTEQNPDIYFLNKIIELQRGKKTIIVLTGTNHELMKDYVHKPGYQANLKAIDQMMAGKPVTYVNLEGVMEHHYFTDHTHFTPEGNQKLADLLWPYLQSE